MQTISTRIPARTAAAQATIVRVLSGDPAPAQAPTVAANALSWHQHQTTTPEQLATPPMPVVSEIEFESDECSPPAAVSNPFAGLVDRAMVSAANDDAIEHEPSAPSRGGDVNARLRRTMALRLVRARLLSGLSQGEVAKLLDYKNQTQINLWEQGRRLAPMADMVRVAEVLHVSVDYLVGASDEPERDQSAALRSACLRGVRKQLEQVAAITVDAVAHHARLVGPHAGHVRGVLIAGDDLLEAFNSFTRANMGEFENSLRGAATLQRRAHELEAALADARTAIRLHDARDAELARALAALGDADPSLIDDLA